MERWDFMQFVIKFSFVPLPWTTIAWIPISLKPQNRLKWLTMHPKRSQNIEIDIHGECHIGRRPCVPIGVDWNVSRFPPQFPWLTVFRIPGLRLLHMGLMHSGSESRTHRFCIFICALILRLVLHHRKYHFPSCITGSRTHNENPSVPVTCTMSAVPALTDMGCLPTVCAVLGRGPAFLNPGEKAGPFCGAMIGFW